MRRNQYMKKNEITFRQIIEQRWKEPNPLILQKIQNQVDIHGYPSISQWPEFSRGEDPVELYSTMMYFLLKSDLPIPSQRYDEHELCELFLKHKTVEVAPFISTSDLNTKLIHRLSGEPYEHDYDQFTLGYFPQNLKLNKLSNFFAQKERMACEVKHRESCNFLWKTERGMSRMMDTIKRVKPTNLTELSLKKTLGISGQVAAQFNVNSSKNIYNLIKGDSIFDISCGWGDRLTGFYLSRKKNYIGTDPNLRMFEVYKKMCLAYEKWLGNPKPEITETNTYFEINGIKKVRIYNQPAEDLPFDEIPNVDLTFSSPPYFDKELYAKDADGSDKQSWNRYSTHDAWLNDFLYVILDNMIPKSKTTIVNITDIGTDISSNRKRICDPMVKRYLNIFAGIIGYQQSKFLTVAKDEPGVYTEPCWVFGENPCKQQQSILSYFE